MTYATAAQRRAIKAIAESRGCKYRITSSGEVHFYGRMPNSDTFGWMFIAWTADDAIREA